MKKLFFAALLFVAGAASGVAQQMPPIPVDPDVRIGKLDNGLTYYIRHNEYPEKVANFYIAQRVGSIQEEDSQRGLAHFLEHMAFNGSEHFKGNGIIDITTHHSEYVYKELSNGHFERQRLRRRPGTIAVAAAIQHRFGVPVQPHVICSGATVEDIEYELLDLQFLGITDLLLLRGDKARDDRTFVPTPGGHAHTTELIRQVQRFNEGYFADGTPIASSGRPFDIGVACYPEKHEEAPNLERDMEYLKMKQDLGAQYAVTQLFFDNAKYFDFVRQARAMGITIPIIPGIKPLARLSQLTVVPKTFHCDIPEALAREIVKCKTDDDARQLGIEWTTEQCRELYQHRVCDIHFYTMGAVDSVVKIVEKLKS